MSQFSPSDFKQRIRDMAEAAGVEIDAPADRCWVSAKAHCGYGAPYGQYVLRPEAFCNNTCQHFRDGGVQIFTPDEVKEKGHEALTDHFNDHHVTVVSELHARASELSDKAEAIALELAADLIEEKKLDRDILLREDLPGEKAFG